jgi:hypothetical protein
MSRNTIYTVLDIKFAAMFPLIKVAVIPGLATQWIHLHVAPPRSSLTVQCLL